MTLTEIKTVVEHITKIKLSSKCRTNEFVFSRWVYFVIAKENTKESLSAIGKKVRRDHATALHGIRMFNIKKEQYPEVTSLYKLCNDKLSDMYLMNEVSEEDLLITKLKKELVKAKSEIHKLKQESNIIKYQPISDLLSLEDESINFICETRLKPALKMLQSKVTNKDLIDKQKLTRTM